jgi:hypothetical protein
MVDFRSCFRAARHSCTLAFACTDLCSLFTSSMVLSGFTEVNEVVHKLRYTRSLCEDLRLLLKTEVSPLPGYSAQETRGYLIAASNSSSLGN